MKLLHALPLTLFALAATAGAAYAWDLGAGTVPERIAMVKGALSSAKGLRDAEPIKLRFAEQPAAPAWTNKTVWTHEEGGRQWVFAVGSKSGIRSTGLALSAAENRARAELNKFINGAKIESKKTKTGSSLSVISTGSVSGAEVIDWYRAKDGTTYALVAAPR